MDPLTWLALVVVATALLRVASYFANRDSFGEPVVWLGLRTLQWVRASRRHAARMAELGPVRPDRAIAEQGCDLVILASREKPGWDEHATVRVDNRFYSIRTSEERRCGRHLVIAYILDEVGENEPLRGIVHTDAKLPCGSGTRGDR